MKYVLRPFLLYSLLLLAVGSFCQTIKAHIGNRHPTLVTTPAPAQLDSRAGSGVLKVGVAAPDFKLPYATQEKIFLKPEEQLSLSSLRGKNVILAFYPADFSGGCTTEVCTLRDSFVELGKLNATVLGISGDYVFSHQAWAKEHNLPFALASDHNHAVAKSYDSFREDVGFNKRTIYLIDKTGIIRFVNLAFKADSKADYDALRAEVVKLNRE